MSGMVRVRLAGFGGQGLGKAGYILGKAVAVHAGREAVYTQEYGPESRGGASSASVVIDDAPIGEPFFERPDILLLMAQAAALRHAPEMGEGCLVLIDADLVARETLPAGANVLGLPATRIAEELGNKVVANIVMLGFLAGVTPGLAPVQALLEAVRSAVPPRTVALNERAFEAGLEQGRRATAGGGGDD